MLTFFFDLACPYAHLAAWRMAHLAERCGTTVDWRPVRLEGLLARHQTQQAPAGAWNAAKVDHGRRDVLRQADAWGIPRQPPRPPRIRARSLLAATAPEQRGPLALVFFRAGWRARTSTTQRWSHGSQRSMDSAASRTRACWTPDAQAADQGIGVPTVVAGDQLFFGSDREGFIIEAVTGERPPPEPPAARPAAPTEVRFFHDFASPFSYLGAMRIESVVAASGCTVSWMPILLGALFRGLGTPNVPLFAFPPAKQHASQRDLFAWARWHDLALQWPTVFPVRTVLPLRVALQAPGLTLPLYRALWEQDRDIGQPSVVAEVARSEGMDPEPLLAGAQTPAVKAQLFANTEQAQELGVCGVPTVAFEDGLRVWGQDRFELVSRLLSGWRPRPEAR